MVVDNVLILKDFFNEENILSILLFRNDKDKAQAIKDMKIAIENNIAENNGKATWLLDDIIAEITVPCEELAYNDIDYFLL